MKRYKDSRAKLDKYVAAQRSLTNKHIKVGFIEGDTPPTSDSGGISIAQLAAVHEFGASIQHPGGTPYAMRGGRLRFVKKGSAGILGITKPHIIKIPERSFLRSWATGKAKQTADVMQKLADLVGDGTLTPDTALNQLGVYGQAGVKQSILDLQTPPLAAATIAKKGSSKPLIDTGTMLGSVRYKVEDGGGRV